MNLIGVRILLLVIGYLFGNIQTAYIYGKMHGIDIREHGSGNAGTTNTLRTLGKKAGLIVFIGDLFKTFVPVLLVGIIWKAICNNGSIEGIDQSALEYTYLLKLYTGFGVILGHNFPFYLGFKGGKGIASSGGLSMGYHPIFMLVSAVTFFSVFSVSNYVSLGSLCMLAAFFIQHLIMGLGKLGPFANISDPVIYEMLCASFVISALAFVRHSENIKRLATKSERKTYIFKKNKKED